MAKPRKKWPPGARGIAHGWCASVNGSIALTIGFVRGNSRAARQTVMEAMKDAGCQDSWRKLYRAGWRIVPVTVTTRRDAMEIDNG